MDNTQEFRIIKKYPNRCLYDTVMRSYITLDEIKELVLNYIAFKVIDAKTNKDVTQSVLFQIIHEQETESSPIFTHQILENMIRFYGHPLQKTMSQFLEESFARIGHPTDDFSKNLKEQQTHLFNTAAKAAEQNMTALKSFFEQYTSFKDPKNNKS